MKSNQSLTKYVAAFLDELVRSNVKHIVVSPGSRSTPIAMVAAEHPEIKVWLNVDERSAAFFALGMAKARREPVAIVCTSGTAVANYMPAVVEAKESQVPLIVLTADRPHELRDVGAPQAIDQIHFFGNQVKWFVEMAIPEDTPDLLRYVRTVAARAVSTSIHGPSGPVHLNFPFREPLVPHMKDIEDEALWGIGLEGRKQFVKVTRSIGQINDDVELEDLVKSLHNIEKGLIICGPYDRPGFAEAIISLAEQLSYPIIADPLSQLRSGSHSKKLILDSYDAFLRDEYIATQYVPDVVIRFGAMPISKAVLLFLKNNPNIRQIIIDGEGLWRDPTLLTSEIIHADPVVFSRSLTVALAKDNGNSIPRSDSMWLSLWISANNMARETLRTLGYEEEHFEGQVVMQLADCLPQHSTLFVGNSMPIRDVDSFFFNNDKNIRVIANRGANGIDGLVSTALGASTAVDPLVLLIGDLSFYHDLNGLLAAKLHQLNVTIVIVNNDGGGIFSFLPQSDHPKNFELLFGTPLGLDYRHVVQMYGGEFIRLAEWESLQETILQSIAAKGLQVIEVKTDRRENADKHRKIWKQVAHNVTKRILS
ncbi:2-succinyl-5-enolpyruvyl-6-hydroxy-3-cyclohexene-1-carboxylic-acid synthase [Calidifontibacillus oryziterrae]|uniref:2-succinyl-5-enolpyruvyl-6-hydroxy-3- cyclohexene-1-carboxylic-acid synthase n=1 Tax=Calidifontibacillus oryziterrae TaxID=1191699 RepID=UPI0002ED8258|nr:2-succinyl-5-enolpyruvyl-6-hydroxy-3-cyclohexene-1-carboxylic-acid synthase [Calidifontibacillus oryziterrae]